MRMGKLWSVGLGVSLALSVGAGAQSGAAKTPGAATGTTVPVWFSVPRPVMRFEPSVNCIVVA